MAEEQPQEDFSALPLTDRFAHKNWKVRKEAYEAAKKEFDNAQTESDPVVRQFVQDTGLWKAAVADSNVAAHQEALAALCAFLPIAGHQGCTRTRPHVIAPLAEKGLISSKPAAKQSALQAILLFIELDKAEPVIQDLTPVLSHKLPKIVAATLTALTAIISTFGTKTVEPKSVVKLLPNVFAHADKNVRAEATNLTAELYRWLREGMKPLFWNDLKQLQQQELEKLFEKIKDDPLPKPQRLLKSQQAVVAARQAAGTQEDDPADAEDAPPEAEAEPEFLAVDIFPKAPKDLTDRLASAKWKDRKEVLDELYLAVNVAAIEPGPFDEIIRGLAKSMKDANIAVVTVAANCVELLANGLRKSFSKYRSTIFGPVIERLKERKQSVTDALAAAIDAICAATSLTDCLEETLAALQHKNPLVKLETTKFLIRSLKNTRTAPALPETKTIAEAISKQLSDSSEPQRNAAAEALGTLCKIMGDRVMNTHLDGLDDIRKIKIKEYMEIAEVRAKYKPKPVAAPPPPRPVAGHATKKSVAKRPAGSATPARKTAPPPAEDYAPPSQPKSTTRTAAPARPAAVAAPRGLKPPGTTVGGKRLATPSKSQPAAPTSPRRSQIQPAAEILDDSPPPAPKGRGLTGRNLAKPAADPVPTRDMPIVPSAFPSIERIELDELHVEADRLRSTNEMLRSEYQKVSSQVHELQNQNAQLIEDHTRDVLSIKAKETQLVRARSDAESAEQNAVQLQREVERLKRELGRIQRVSSPKGDPDRQETHVSDSVAMSRRVNGVTSPTFREGPISPMRPQSMQPSNSRPSSRTQHLQPSNGNRQSNSHPSVTSPDLDVRSLGSSSSSTMAGPGVHEGEVDGQSKAESGQESWRRAAEVTQNLKARIELMKAKQHQRG